MKNKKHYNVKENHPQWKGGFPLCEICGQILKNRYALKCQKCYIEWLKQNIKFFKRINQKGERNPNYGNHKLAGENNPMFGKKRIEMSKRQRGNGNAMWKGGKPHCKDCGKEVWYGSIRCNICAPKHTSYHGSRGRNNGMFGKPARHSKWITFKRIRMRSSWEVKYAKYLTKKHIKWQYEPKAFDLGETTYRPDFYLPETNEYIEIKGRWFPTSKKKFKLFKKLYFAIKIVLLTKKELSQLKII